MQRPFEIEQMTLQVGASVGIARFPLDGDDPHTLLRRADMAMYAAKDANRGVDLYASGLDRDSRQRLSLLSDFRRALEQEELVVHYQPIVDVRGAEVRGAEGLVRWEHPEHGLLPPGAFIAAVEQTGLIGPLTRHVLERSIAQCATLAHRRQGPLGRRQPVGPKPDGPRPANVRSPPCSTFTDCLRTPFSWRSPRA